MICGIKKYDRLPARIALTDVDALRFELHRALMKTKLIRKILNKAIRRQ